MKQILLLTMATIAIVSTQAKNITTPKTNGYPITQVPFTAVKVNAQTFWGQRIKAAREVTIPLAFEKCETTHRYDNFKMAAYTLQHPGHNGLQTPQWDVSKLECLPFDDTDVYKTIEGASYILQTYPDNRLKQYIDSILDIVAAAQEPDGYLYTSRTVNPAHPHQWSGAKRWVEEEALSHELYNLGHMVDAACAHYQATGSNKFLNIARRYADCVIREVGPRPGQVCVTPGHQIAEMALTRLYLLTGDKRYLDEAKFLLDYRGKTSTHTVYSQSHKPVVEQTEAWGHAVRAGYMYAGMADVAALTGDTAYINALNAICNNIVSRKYYITGGVGARHEGEAFGADYELPNLTAYNETCAAIAMVYLFHRMFLMQGDAKYIDCMERTLYNGVISGMSVDGGRFFYPNPLSSDGNTERQPWFGCACCPSNICRFIPSFPGYVYAVKDRTLYVNLFTGNTAHVEIGGKTVVLEQQTDYPWNGDINLRIQKNQAKAFAMAIRIPGWAVNTPVPSDLYRYTDCQTRNYQITVNGKPVDGVKTDKGYLIINRVWKKGDVVSLHLDMPVRTVVANPQVTDDRGRVAVERGPLVYCAEAADNTSHSIFRFLMPTNPQFNVVDRTINGQHQVSFGVKAIEVDGQTVDTDADGRVKVSDTRLTLIPYYAWNHRGADDMEVWLPQSIEALGNYR